MCADLFLFGKVVAPTYGRKPTFILLLAPCASHFFHALRAVPVFRLLAAVPVPPGPVVLNSINAATRCWGGRDGGTTPGALGDLLVMRPTVRGARLLPLLLPSLSSPGNGLSARRNLRNVSNWFMWFQILYVVNFNLLIGS